MYIIVYSVDVTLVTVDSAPCELDAEVSSHPRCYPGRQSTPCPRVSVLHMPPGVRVPSLSMLSECNVQCCANTRVARYEHVYSTRCSRISFLHQISVSYVRFFNFFSLKYLLQRKFKLQ